MKTIGFKREINGEVKELLPTLEGFNTIYQRRAIFLELVNANLPAKSKINLRNVNFELDVYETIFDHIITLTKTVKTGCSGCGCTAGSLLIVQNFFNAINYKKKDEELVDKNICAASKIISLFKISAFSIDLNLDLDRSFTNLVYHRMLPKNNDKTLICHSDKIEVKEEGRKALTIYPKWEDVDSASLYTIDDEIEKAGNTMSNHCNQVYLVFPKNTSFKKHIKVLHTGIKEDEEIKLIPYSFSFCDRKLKKSA